ncbi:hypothetical protein ABBQ38_005728 [Trebouxia sp. C0009 RCD-2024]
MTFRMPARLNPHRPSSLRWGGSPQVFLRSKSGKLWGSKSTPGHLPPVSRPLHDQCHLDAKPAAPEAELWDEPDRMAGD